METLCLQLTKLEKFFSTQYKSSRFVPTHNYLSYIVGYLSNIIFEEVFQAIKSNRTAQWTVLLYEIEQDNIWKIWGKSL